ncbi:glycine zipper domain-containing protein [Roseococcus sp. DSY-14]|uniref:glycine zipper domain-containing protein n=1 Tax=Roseococcus sp. DSY-14 TaxID=3369650 RepID=UPI00387AA93B
MTHRTLRAGLLALVLAGGGCAAPYSDSGRGAATGAVIGGLGGAAIGSISGDAGWGAAIGAGVGALGGYAAGRAREERREAYWRGHRHGRRGW